LPGVAEMSKKSNALPLNLLPLFKIKSLNSVLKLSVSPTLTLKRLSTICNRLWDCIGTAKYRWDFPHVKRPAYGAILVFFTVSQAFSAPQVDQNRLVLAAEGGKQVAITNSQGKVLWKRKIRQVHDLHMLDNGHILVNDGWPHIVELDLLKNVVWSYDSSTQNGNSGKKVEVHAFQRLTDGVTLIAESGPCRLIEVDQEGKLLKEIPLQVAEPHPHTDTRLVRKLENGDYLVCHEGTQVVKRYNSEGEVIWEFPIPLFGKEPAKGHGPEAWGGKTFGAIVAKNGNYLITTGNGHGVLEVTPEKEIVWRLAQNDIPGVTLAWVTTIQEQPNGNLIIGNCHAGPDNPQIVEITRDKEVVWSWKNFEEFGNALSNSLVIDGDRAIEIRKALEELPGS